MPRSIVPTLIAAHGLAVAALAVAVGWTHDKPRPCRKTFERVQVGMTRAEVEATVGGPPGDYSSADWWPPSALAVTGLGDHRINEVEWICNADELHVWYSNDGDVREVSIGPSYYHRQPSRGERVWSWITTGDDSPRFYFTRRAVGPYDLDRLRGILAP